MSLSCIIKSKKPKNKIFKIKIMILKNYKVNIKKTLNKKKQLKELLIIILQNINK